MISFGGLLQGAASLATGGASDAVLGQISDKAHNFSLESNEDKHKKGIVQRVQAAEHNFENSMVDTGLDNMTNAGDIVEGVSRAVNGRTLSYVVEQYG